MLFLRCSSCLDCVSQFLVPKFGDVELLAGHVIGIK
jgi:hypothetical protein